MDRSNDILSYHLFSSPLPTRNSTPPSPTATGATMTIPDYGLRYGWVSVNRGPTWAACGDPVPRSCAKRCAQSSGRTSHGCPRCGTEPEIGSITLLVINRLRFEPFSLNGS